MTGRGEQGRLLRLLRELLKSILAPPVPRVLGLCAFLSTSALIFAKDIISFIAHNELLGRREAHQSCCRSHDFRLLCHSSPAVQRTGSAQVSINLQEGTCQYSRSIASTCGVE